MCLRGGGDYVYKGWEQGTPSFVRTDFLPVSVSKQAEKNGEMEKWTLLSLV